MFVSLERLFPIRHAKLFRPHLGPDLAYYFINGIVPATVVSLPVALAAYLAHHWIPPGATAWFANLPTAARIMVALTVAEIGLYWGHRWSHGIPLLWRFHAVHHSPIHVDWLVNSRGHPVDFVFTGCAA